MDFCLYNNIKLPSINSLRGQILALFTHNKNMIGDRECLNMFLNKINLVSKDCIQLINKVDQIGILHSTNQLSVLLCIITCK